MGEKAGERLVECAITASSEPAIAARIASLISGGVTASRSPTTISVGQ